MAGIDVFLLLTPVLLLAVAMLLVFVGCDGIYGLSHTSSSLNLQATPGIPAPNTRITPVDLAWNTNANTQVKRATAGQGPALIGTSSTGSYTDETVTDGTEFIYTVDDGDGHVGGPVSVTPQPPFVSSLASLAGIENQTPSHFPETFLGMALTIGGNSLTVYALGHRHAAQGVNR